MFSNWNWGYGGSGSYVNVNASRATNIDRTYNRANVGADGRWQHDGTHRKGVAYRDPATRQQFGQSRPGADQRQQFRGQLEGRSGAGGPAAPAAPVASAVPAARWRGGPVVSAVRAVPVERVALVASAVPVEQVALVAWRVPVGPVASAVPVARVGPGVSAVPVARVARWRWRCVPAVPVAAAAMGSPESTVASR